jgi:DNA-binding MarR family transcriptional regulator
MDHSDEMLAAVRGLRAFILAGEHYRQVLAQVTGLGVTETQAVSYLAIHDERGQNELGAALGITSSASTALVDRLERQGIAERFAHPRDRRRLLVRLTPRGRRLVDRSHDWLASSLEDVLPQELPKLTARLTTIASNLRDQSARIEEQGSMNLDPGPS